MSLLDHHLQNAKEMTFHLAGYKRNPALLAAFIIGILSYHDPNTNAPRQHILTVMLAMKISQLVGARSSPAAQGGHTITILFSKNRNLRSLLPQRVEQLASATLAQKVMSLPEGWRCLGSCV